MRLNLIFSLLVFVTLNGQTQTYNIAVENGNTINTCSGSFVASGGGTSTNYSDNEDYTVTFCSDNGDFLSFDFSGAGDFDMNSGTGDTLFVYDGTSTSGDLINTLTLDDDFSFSELQMATFSTCVTFHWVSDASGNDDGWVGIISCITPSDCNGNAPASDIFEQATHICNLNGYCGNTGTYYGEDRPFNMVGGGNCPTLFGGTLQNNSWLSFTANSTSIDLTFDVGGCSDGIQVGIFAFDGTNFFLISDCSQTDGNNNGNFTVTGTGMTPGQTYYIMVDGNAGSNCQYTITAPQGAVMIVDAGADQTICPGDNATLSASGPPGAIFTWTELGGANPYNGNPHSVSPSVTTSYVVEVSGGGVCESSTDTVTVNIDSNCAGCTASTGTVTVSGGTQLSATEYNLTNCETISFTATNEDLGGGILTYGWAIFNCNPTLPLSASELSDLNNHPCYVGSDYGLTTSDLDAGGISGTIPGGFSQLWVLPYTSDMADSPDSDGDGCYDIGNVIQLNYLAPVCGDCNSPTCGIGQVNEFPDRTYALCNDPCVDLNDMTYTTYHTVQTDGLGNVGIAQSVSASCQVSRTAVLRETTNSCTGSDILPTATNANGLGSGFNPEWYGLLPNTQYTLIITTVIGPGCNYDYACVDFYGIPGCASDAGTTVVSTSDPSNNDYILCWGESIDISTSGFTLPDGAGNEGLGYAVYRNPMPGTTPNISDADFVEYLIGSGTNASLTLTNNGSYAPPFINNPNQTIYLYPVTMDDTTNNDIDADGDLCFSVGAELSITFLNDISTSLSQNCTQNQSIITVQGGYPEFFTDNYNFTNLGSGSLSSNQLSNSGGFIEVNGLVIGDVYGVQIVDGNNCSQGPVMEIYPSNLDFDSILVTPATCSYSCDGAVTVYSSNAAQYNFGVSFSPVSFTTGLCPGQLTISIEDNGCVMDSTISIPAPNEVSINVSPDTTVCIGGTATLSALATGGTGTLDYYWNNAIGAPVLDTSPSSMETLEVFALDSSGCSSDTLNVSVSLFPPLSIDVLQNDTICGGELGNLAGLVSGGNGIYSYSWTASSSNFTSSNLNISDTPSVTTTYTLTASDGCETPSTSDSGLIIVNPTPSINILSDTLTGCYPLTVNFSNQFSDPDYSCYWSFSNGASASDCDPSITFEAPGCYDATLEVTSSSGCSFSAFTSSIVCVEEYPSAYFTFDSLNILSYHPTVEFTNLSSDNILNLWTAEDQSTESFDMTHTFSQDYGQHEVCLYVENTIGCADSFCDSVSIEDPFSLFVPNSFTPNGDGLNDVFNVVSKAHLIEEFELTIFDRWGQVLFQTTDLNEGWNGLSVNAEAPQGTYIWLVEYKLEDLVRIQTQKGHVTLLR